MLRGPATVAVPTATLAVLTPAEDNMTSDELAEQHELLGRAVTKLISEHAARLDAARVTSRATPEELKRLFAEPLPQAGSSAEQILQQFAEKVGPDAMQ